MILDDQIAKYYTSHVMKELEDIVVHKRRDVGGNSYGIVTFDENVTEYFRSFIESNMDQLPVMIEETMKHHMVC